LWEKLCDLWSNNRTVERFYGSSGSWGKAGSGGIRLSCCIGRKNGSDASRRCCYPWIG
jgi:hypothetical protein